MIHCHVCNHGCHTTTDTECFGCALPVCEGKECSAVRTWYQWGIQRVCMHCVDENKPTVKQSVTHAELVDRAAKWLSATRKCVLTLQEPQCYEISEYPDAIGWNVAGESILVECKVSRSDFHKDKAKVSKRQGCETMGLERWFLAPVGLLKATDMPVGYGLLEAHATRVQRVCEASKDERPGRDAAEMPILVWAARKEAWAHGWKGRQVKLTSEPEVTRQTRQRRRSKRRPA